METEPRNLPPWWDEFWKSVENNIPDIRDPAICKVLWSAMCSMMRDIHAPEENLSEDEWMAAEATFLQLDAMMNKRESCS
jgi:hypothetical protein